MHGDLDDFPPEAAGPAPALDPGGLALSLSGLKHPHLQGQLAGCPTLSRACFLPLATWQLWCLACPAGPAQMMSRGPAEQSPASRPPLRHAALGVIRESRPHATLGSSLVVRALQGGVHSKGGWAYCAHRCSPSIRLTVLFPFFPFWPMIFYVTPRIPIPPRAAGHPAKTRWVRALWKPTESASTCPWLRDSMWLPGLFRGWNPG